MRVYYLKSVNGYSPEVKEQDQVKYFNQDLPKWIEALNKRILKKEAKQRKYIVGDKGPTIADFVLTAWAYSHYLNPESVF